MRLPRGIHSYLYSTLYRDGYHFKLINVTIVAPDDELLFLTAAFGPNATVNSGSWVTQPSAGIARISPVPVREEGRD